ncbi:hypothetical protein FOMPIDRAFT_1043178 [Fomitopsis schrenkii]|uniref:Uncharacterized protein n=1 Tax=Fomitopsis schrenkii TaxID=2126942 RepID=S8DZ96_FOMSC|nr:hypothetical protein FOMPIDRAFT_1043178 [Fomitopsis schrenkii]
MTTVHSATTETQRYTETTVTETSVWTVTYTSHGHTSVTVLSSVVISGSLIPEASDGKTLLAQNHGALAGVIVGSLALLSFLAVLLIIALRRHRKHKADESAAAAALADGGRRRPTNMLADEDDDLPPTPGGGMAHVGDPATFASGVAHGGYDRLRGGHGSDTASSTFDKLNGSGSAFGHLTRFSEQSALADLALGSNYYAGAFAAEADGSDEMPANGGSGEDGYTRSSSGGDHLSAAPLLGPRTSGSGSRSRDSSGFDPASWLSGKDVAYAPVPLSASASSNVLSPPLNAAGFLPVGSTDPFADPAPPPHPCNNTVLTAGDPFVDDPADVTALQRGSWDESGLPGAGGSSAGHGAHSHSAGYHSGESANALASGPASSSGHGNRERDDGWSSDGHALSSTGHGDTAARRSSLLPTNPGAPPTAYRAPPADGEDSEGGQTKGRRLSFLGSVRRPWKRRASMSDASAEYVDARSSFPPGSSSDARTSQYTDARLSAASSAGGGVPMRSVTISPATSQQALNVLNAASARLPFANAGGEGTFGHATAVTGTARSMRRPHAPTLPTGSIPPPPVIQVQSHAYPYPYTQYPAPVVAHGQGMLPPSAFGYAHHVPYPPYTAADTHPWRGLVGLFGAPDVPSPAPTEASSAGAPEGLLDPHRLGAHAAGMQSSGAISFRDEVDYSRPIGGLVNRRQHSATTLRTTSTRQRRYEDEDSRSHLDDHGHGDEDEEDISYLRGVVF